MGNGRGKQIGDIQQSVLLKLCVQVITIRPYSIRTILTTDGRKSRGNVDVSYADALQTTFSIANLLKDKEKMAWVKNELEGWKSIKEMPIHRFIRYFVGKRIGYLPITSSVYDLEVWLRKDADLNRTVPIAEYDCGVKMNQIKYILDRIHHQELVYATEIINLLKPPKDDLDMLFSQQEPQKGEEKYAFNQDEQ